MEEYIINGYRGFKNTKFKISDITIFTGENGHGKTSITNLINFIRKNKKINSINSHMISNSNNSFEIFHTFDQNFLDEDQGIDKEIYKGYEYYWFTEKDSILNIEKYATMRGNDLIFFWHEPNKFIKYWIINEFKFSDINDGIKKIKKIGREYRERARLIPWPRQLKHIINFNEMFSAWRWISDEENADIANLKLFKNARIDFYDLKNEKKEVLEGIIEYISVILNKGIRRIYDVESAIISKTNFKSEFISTKIARGDNIHKWLTDPQFFKDYINFLKRANMPNKFSLEEIETKTGSYKNIIYEVKNGNFINFNEVGDGVAAITPFYIGLIKAPMPIIREPEIHMHPSAIAEFGSEIFKTNKKIILETHSSALVDRIRYENSICKDKKDIVINTIFSDSEKKDIEIIKVGEDGRFDGANKYMEFVEDEALKWFR